MSKSIVVSLRADNFKRLRAVQVKPTGSVVEIAGRNGQGKSSVLDAIMAAIGGGRAIPEQAIRKGAKKGEVEVDLGDLLVRRTFTESGGTLKVTAKDGSEIRSPQAVLDRMLGSLTFDPLAFARMSPRDQVSSLMRVSGLEEEFARFAKERADAEALRRDAGREVDRLKAQLQAVPDIEGPDEETSASEIMSRFRKAQERNSENAEERKWLRECKTREQGLASEVADLERRLEEARGHLASLRAEIAKSEPEINALVDIDTSAIQAELDSLESNNQRARTRKARHALSQQLEHATAKHREQDRRLENIAEQREQRIAESNLPVKGLRFTDDGLFYNGVPFEQASSSEKIRVSARLGLAQGNDLRVMLIRDGSLLDDDAMAELTAIAEQYDAQVWVERVGDDVDGFGVVIEDGEVKEVHRPAAVARKIGGAA